MDWDEPVKKTTTAVGEDLSSLSVEELQHRIQILELEIERVRTEIKTRKNTQNTAEDAFRN